MKIAESPRKKRDILGCTRQLSSCAFCGRILYSSMGWLRLVGFFKIQVFFAEYGLFYRALLQKRPIIWRSPLIVATQYQYYYQYYMHSAVEFSIRGFTLSHFRQQDALSCRSLSANQPLTNRAHLCHLLLHDTRIRGCALRLSHSRTSNHFFVHLYVHL